MDSFFPRETLNSIIGGGSGLDLPRLHLTAHAHAVEFLGAYGYAWDQAGCRHDLEQLRQLGLDLLGDLLDDEELPAWLVGQDDVPRLLVTASGTDSTAQRWACALLRVMHTFAHADSHLDDRYGADIRAQIAARFRPHLRPDPRKPAFLGDIPLVGFELKAQKSRRSSVMKLLHKPQNVATGIFDRIGVRFITPTTFDALRVVRYLRLHNVIVFANVKPARTRNSLVDLDQVQDRLSKMTAADVPRLRRQPLPAPDAPPHDNPFSSVDYRAIQFTCRQMIRSQGVRFFFPFEIQILDVESYEASRSGLASHEEYKARQRQAVRERVLGSLCRPDPDDPSCARS